MTPPSDTSVQSTSSSRSGPQSFAAVRMPVEVSGDDLETAVRKLKQCSTTELHRARQHHRRAIESLKNGGYSALSESTRNRLTSHLQENLEALNLALDLNDTSPDGPSDPEETEQTKDSEASLSGRVKTFVRGLWSS